jgi:uncharacterized membrane protein (UPF0127 family)
MRYTIDVAFIDSAGIVIDLATVKPSSTAYCKASVAVLEMAEGTVSRLHFEVGDKLLLEMKQWH